MMNDVSVSELKKAVESTHGCKAIFKEQVSIEEKFKGLYVWRGVVSLFDIKNHAKAKICYAWSSPIKGSKKRKFYAVLGIPPVNSAKDAVRAAIVSDFKSNE